MGIGGASGWDGEFASSGSPRLSGEGTPTVPSSAVGELIGESGSGVCVGERGVVSGSYNGVGAFVEIGVFVAFVETSVDASPIPKDREARSLSSNRDRGRLKSCNPPLPLAPVWAGLGERCACNDLRMLESAESARWLEDGIPPSEFVRDMTLGLEASLS